jgi:hypothetical protein
LFFFEKLYNSNSARVKLKSVTSCAGLDRISNRVQSRITQNESTADESNKNRENNNLMAQVAKEERPVSDGEMFPWEKPPRIHKYLI